MTECCFVNRFGCAPRTQKWLYHDRRRQAHPSNDSSGRRQLSLRLRLCQEIFRLLSTRLRTCRVSFSLEFENFGLKPTTAVIGGTVVGCGQKVAFEPTFSAQGVLLENVMIV